VYNELYEAWRKEMENKEIQMLPKDFYVRLADYVRKMREESRMLDKKTTRAKLMEREFKNVKTLIKKLLQLRYKKSLDNAKTGKPVPKDHLTEEEERLYAEMSLIRRCLKKFLEGASQVLRVKRRQREWWCGFSKKFQR